MWDKLAEMNIEKKQVEEAINNLSVLATIGLQAQINLLKLELIKDDKRPADK